jgi:hypothetical protein
MLRKTLFVLCVVCAALLLGCYKSATTNNSNSMGNSNMASSSNSATSTTSSSSTASSGEKIGIPECDEFITAYEACVAKVPDAQRTQYKENIEAWRKTWRQLAANPMTRGTLAAVCKQSVEQAKDSMKSYGCKF